MKTVQIGFINNRFDEQYTFELQGYVRVVYVCGVVVQSE